MASQISLPSTPQQNTSYDTYMQSLQQKLSSISMQNAATLLHVDSSAPTSGTATTEMLSPVQEFEASNETPKHNNNSYKNLNNELTKINARKESVVVVTSEAVPQNELQPDQFDEKPEKLDTKPQEKIRRISRFKVSVVTEPDPAKLIIKPEPKNRADDATTSSTTSTTSTVCENVDVALKHVPSLQDIPSTLDNHLKLHESVTLINNTMLQLQENVQTSYLTQAKTMIAAVPSGWTTENNETFEDMLGRQQAELNALIEAHRKQQIEYMKSITEVSKNSGNRKDS